MYDVTSIDPIPNYPDKLDGNIELYDDVLLKYLDGNFYPASEATMNPYTTFIISRSLKAQESYSFKVSDEPILASENSPVGIYYDGNFSLIDTVHSRASKLDGNELLVDEIPLLDFYTDLDKRLIVYLAGHKVNLYDRVQYLPNDMIVVKCDIDGYYEWSSPTANGNFLLKSRFNDFSANVKSLSFGKDHGFISNYPVSRNYDLKSYYDNFQIRGVFGSVSTKTSRSRPLELVASVPQFAMINNILRDLNNEEDKYRISPANMYVKIENDVTVAVYSSNGVLQRLNESIQAVPSAVDLSKYPEVTAPFVFVNPLAKPLSSLHVNIPEILIEWPWQSTDGSTIQLPRTEQIIKGVILFNTKYYWCTLKATSDLNHYAITSMSELKPGFDFEYYRYNFVVMEEHNRTSYVKMH